MANALLERAAHQAAPASRRGVLERLFTLMFQGFVYNQIWEDPSVDLDALKLEPHHRLVTIASGGCNVLNYLAAAPAKIVALDLNPHHVALTKLKLAALAHLPDHESFFRFFGEASDPANLDLFDSHLRDQLDAETRAYWQAMSGAPKRRRIEMFARNLYRHGLLGRFIGLLHGVARLHGKNLEDMLDAKNPREQRDLFNQIVAPLFESAPIKLMSKSPISLYALGIPPAQYDALVESGSDAISVLRERVERLACDFPIQDNYFAWQAFGRGYDLEAPRGGARLSEGRKLRDAEGAHWLGQRHSRLAAGFSQGAAGAVARPLRAAGCAGLDEPGPARRIVARDRPHRPFARRAGDLPHRGRRQSPAAEAAGRSSGALALS